MGKTKIMFASFPDFSSNARPLYEYMKKTYNDTMEFSWAVNSEESVKRLSKMGIKAYKVGNDDYFEYAKDVDVFFSTHCNIVGEKNEKSLYIELWHGISQKNLGYLSDNMMDSDKEWYNMLSRKVDYFILPSDFWRVIFSTRFNVPYGRTLNLGFPKFNYFVYSDGKKNLEKILNIKLSEYNKILYYMPTFRKGCNREQESNLNEKNIINIEEYNELELTSYLEKNNYLLCVKKHPSEEINVNLSESRNIKLITEEALQENDLTVNEILNAADVMISDYSSLGLEFTFLNKPVIYLVNNLEEYNKNRGITFGNNNFWMPGYKVKNISELLNGIDETFTSNKYVDIQKERRNLWFDKNLKDGGCVAICDYFFENGKVKEKFVPYVDIRDTLKNRVDELEKDLEDKRIQIEIKDKLISDIINSKGWRFLEKMRKIKKVFTRKKE